MCRMMETGGKICEGQAAVRSKRSWLDHVCTLRRIILGRKDAGLTTCRFFLDVKKDYGTGL